MKTIRKTFTPNIRSINEKDRTIEFVSSTEAVDRYGDVIRVAGWQTDAYQKNPVFLWAHRSGDQPIGRTVELHVESKPPALVQKVQFADKDTYEFADTIFNLYKKGFLRGVSVGFRPLDQPNPILDDATGAQTGHEFVSQELLELSAVPIPANAEALARGISTGEISALDAKKLFVKDGGDDGNDGGDDDTDAIRESARKLHRHITKLGQLWSDHLECLGQKDVGDDGDDGGDEQEPDADDKTISAALRRHVKMPKRATKQDMEKFRASFHALLDSIDRALDRIEAARGAQRKPDDSAVNALLAEIVHN